MLGFTNSARRSVAAGLSASRLQPPRVAAVCLNSSRMLTTRNTHSSSTMHDNDPEILEREKQRNLSGQQFEVCTEPIAPGWNEALASASEAFVKADRDNLTNTEELAKETINLVTRKYDPENRSGSTTAEYTKDEVSGPLRGALGAADATIESLDADEVTVFYEKEKTKSTISKKQ
ncbi:hypothetical protein D9611_001808 [Ephemerocybe angulata]|uniref:Uncharacterized protein n=1 Tax=Ephemerocybe angulata TaxID=980116 RepID=A0A8H5CIZ5_9AGAR|nr:hypothetical protein D9611_001808 [Tulosesus angulatus]